MLGIKCKVAFFTLFETLLALACLLLLKLGLFHMKLGTQHDLVCINFLKWLEWKAIFIRLKLSAKLCFQGY